MTRVCYFLFVLTALNAHAQFAAPPVITSTGEEQLTVVPTYFEFGFNFVAKEETIAKSIDTVAASIFQFKKYVEESEFGGVIVSESGPRLRDIHSTFVVSYLVLRFDARILPEEKDRLGSFGALCDEIVELSKRFNATAAGPLFGVEDEQTSERTAVQRATENALFRAEAIAELMSTRIYEVEKVEVDSVEWIAESIDPLMQPTIEQIVCDARVTVTYRHEP